MLAERARAADEVERAREARDAQAVKVERVEAKWSDYLVTDEAEAELVLPMVERERAALVGADTRLRAAEDALASVPTSAPTDAMLDFANALQRAVRGRLNETGSLAEVNAPYGTSSPRSR